MVLALLLTSVLATMVLLATIANSLFATVLPPTTHLFAHHKVLATALILALVTLVTVATIVKTF